jgi:chemotaxis protein methyltransferase CheR
VSPDVTLAQQLRLRDLVATQLGLRFDDGRLDFLGEVLQRRSQAQGLTAAAYLVALALDPREAWTLAEELTVGETYFFRDGDQFRTLAETVLPDLRRRHAGRSVNILSAGCSSGEEAYTVAMVAEASAVDVAIRAVDLNPAVLRKAALGRYGSWSLRETPDLMQQRWFAPQGRDMLLSPAIRAAVHFERGNLVEPDGNIWLPRAYDVVFCRNVIMYFTPAMQQVVIERIAEALAPGGYLFLGHAETLRGLSDAFSLVQAEGTFIYQRKPGSARRRRPAPSLAATLASPPDSPPADTSWYTAIADASRRIEALAQPAPPCQPQPKAQAWDIEMAFALMRHERFAEALELIDRAPEALARTSPVRLVRAVLLSENGQPGAAAADCAALLAAGDLGAETHHLLALGHEGRGEPAEALRHYDIAAGLDAHFAMPRLRGGIVARRLGRLEAAGIRLAAARPLLEAEDAFRLLLFGGGFAADALARLCDAELRACEAAA